MKSTVAAVLLCLAAIPGTQADETSAPWLSAVLAAAAHETQQALPAPPALPPASRASRSVSARPGGTATAWVSGFDVYLQRHDKAGAALGSAMKLPLPVHGLPVYRTPPAVVVLAHGGIVVLTQRVGPPRRGHPPHSLHTGVYLQRFAPDGTRLHREKTLASMHQYDRGSVGKGRQDLVDLRLLALSDGSFVASWGVRYGGCLGCGTVALFMQRFDPAGQPSTPVFTPVRDVLGIAEYNPSFEWTADGKGGFTVTGTWYDRFVDGTARPLPVHESTYYPPGGGAVRILKATRRA